MKEIPRLDLSNKSLEELIDYMGEIAQKEENQLVKVTKMVFDLVTKTTTVNQLINEVDLLLNILEYRYYLLDQMPDAFYKDAKQKEEVLLSEKKKILETNISLNRYRGLLKR